MECLPSLFLQSHFSLSVESHSSLPVESDSSFVVARHLPLAVKSPLSAFSLGESFLLVVVLDPAQEASLAVSFAV